MSAAPNADLASLLPHLADTPRRIADLLPLLAQAHALHASSIAALNQRFLARILSLKAGIPDPGSGKAGALPYFAHVREMHGLQAQWIEQYIDTLELAAPQAERLRFALRQWIEARDPDNFPATNPQVLQETIHTAGENLRRGQAHLRADIERGRITMSDPSAFQIGVDIATTPGVVVFENELIQVIRYQPLTTKVYGVPILMVPPFINKYYILDLSASDSFVRFALERGFQVFMISWRNIGSAQASLTWDDYALMGIGAAVEATLNLSRSPSIHALGFCIGGTLLASALASCLPAQQVASLTLLASLLDFSNVGDIGHYIDAAFAARCETLYADGGVVPGAQLAAAFASLRPRELVWKFFIGNYLMGRIPPAFDLLHWNGDSANLPGRLFAWYVKELYLHNRLAQANALQINGRSIDLGTLRMPAYVLGTEHDHIVPWKSAYTSTQLLQGERQFVLGSSGHIAGIISPPSGSRRSFRVGSGTPPDAQQWLQRSEHRAGSWWPHWSQWLNSIDSTVRKAPRQLGNRRYSVIEAAPGRYVSEVPR